MGFLWFVVWLGFLAFAIGFLLTVVFGGSFQGTAAVAAIGLLAIVALVGAVIVAAPSEPVHESVGALGRHVSPYLWFFAALNLLGWMCGVAAGWVARRAARLSHGR